MLIHHECALFCSMASYSDGLYLENLDESSMKKYLEREETLQSWGWVPLSNSETLGVGSEHGYFGCAYYKCDHETKTAEFVVAHRGTCFDEVGNVLADLAIAEGSEPAILREAAFKYITLLFKGRDFYNPDHDVFPFSINNYRVSKITHTGFSLGGFIAGACVCLSKHAMLEAVTFDAPGIGALELPIEEALVAPRIVNYVTRPNLINTCNKHIGEVREIVMSFREPLNEEINFKVNLADLGFGVPKQLPSDHSCDDLKDWVKEGKEQRQKQKSTNAVMRETRMTLDSHDLEKVIGVIEQKFEYNPVYKWPKARNAIIYGEEPKIPNDFYTFGFDSIGSSIFSMAAILLQGTKQVGSSVLWNLTKKMDGKNEIGVVGIKHSRKNIVYYSQTEYLKSLEQNTPEIPTQEPENLGVDNVVPLTWLQSVRDQQPSEGVLGVQNNVSGRRRRPARKG